MNEKLPVLVGLCTLYVEQLQFISHHNNEWNKISTEIFPYIVSLKAGTERVETS
jgi:hypothetical protein